MTPRINLLAKHSPAEFIPGTSRSPAVIWLGPYHKLFICPGDPLLDRIRRVSHWQYMSYRKAATR